MPLVLHWLLELARVERIDLRKLSICALVDAFAAALEQALASSARADLSRWGECLSTASQLTLLRSRLLLPPEHREAKSVQDEAEALPLQLLEGDAVRRAAAWLEARTRLGREVFGRGVPPDQCEASAPLADITDLFGPAWRCCARRSTRKPFARLCRSCGACRTRSPGSQACSPRGWRGNW